MGGWFCEVTNTTGVAGTYECRTAGESLPIEKLAPEAPLSEDLWVFISLRRVPPRDSESVGQPD